MFDSRDARRRGNSTAKDLIENVSLQLLPHYLAVERHGLNIS
jgi:hypothetical protein